MGIEEMRFGGRGLARDVIQGLIQATTAVAYATVY